VLKSAARELGLDLTRTEDEIQITSLEEGAGPPSSQALQTIAGSIEEFESTLATVQDEADTELRSVIQHLLAEAVKGCFSPVRGQFSRARPSSLSSATWRRWSRASCGAWSTSRAARRRRRSRAGW
jgi:hypothetical protein